MTRAALLACLCLVGPAVAEHPVKKVIGLLEGLATQVEEEGKEEALLHQKFEYWCANSLKTLGKTISAEAEAISALGEQIASAKGQQEQLTKEISELATRIGEYGVRESNLNSQRQEENQVYELAEGDLNATLDGIDGAIQALLASDNKSTVFMQVLRSEKVQSALEYASVVAPKGSQSSRVLSALLQGSEGDGNVSAMGDYEAHIPKYDFKSNQVIEMLKTLKRDFEDQVVSARTGETNSVNAYNLAKQSLAAQATAAQNSKDEKGLVLTDVGQSLATWESDLLSKQGDKQTDEATHAATSKTCMVKKQEWQDRSAVRANEIEALHAAVKILTKAAGVTTDAPSNPVPPVAPVLMQGRASGQALLQHADPRQKAVALLKAAAQKFHSHSMERFAQELATHMDDPFGEVINSIQKMVFHLMDEQRHEDEHKAWCDEELSHNNASKINKEDKISELTEKIDVADALIATLTSDIADAQAKIGQIDAFMAEANEIRLIGKKQNAEAVADAQHAQAAIADATAVLEAFYKESGMMAKESWELLQQQQRQPVTLGDSPSTWDSSYTGVSDPNQQPGGIITVLKEIASAFATMEADTRAQESTDKSQFETDNKDNLIARAERQQEVETKNQEKARQTEIVSSLTKKRKHAADELEKVDQYLADLVPACLAGDSTYQDRKFARDQEVEALRQAEAILKDAFNNQVPAPAPAAAPSAAFAYLRGIRIHA